MDLRVDHRAKISEVSDCVQGELMGDPSVEVAGVCLDSRCVRDGDLFVAIESERDGHGYVEDALNAGARAAIVRKPIASKKPQIKVENTTVAIHDLAKAFRAKWNKPIVAISGSNGKTTTKVLCAGILSTVWNTYRTPASWNNHLGVPLSLIALNEAHDCAVIEMGMNHSGELERLCKIAVPNVVCLTNVGRAHLGHFSSVEEIADAKFELFENSETSACLVINQDDERIRSRAETLKEHSKIYFSMRTACDVFAERIRFLNNRRTVFDLKYGTETLSIETEIEGSHNIKNLVAAMAIAFALEVPSEKLLEAIPNLKLPDMRFERISFANKIEVISDSYNANPDSMRAALEIGQSSASKHKIAVLGEMKELGKDTNELHFEVGAWVAKLGFSALFVFGESGEFYAQGAVHEGMTSDQVFHFSSKDEMEKSLLSHLSSDALLVVKGSRGSKMETVVEFLGSNLERARS